MVRCRDHSSEVVVSGAGQGRTYGDLEVYGLIANLSVNHCCLQKWAKEEELLNFPSGILWNIKKKSFFFNSSMFQSYMTLNLNNILNIAVVQTTLWDIPDIPAEFVWLTLSKNNNQAR